MELKIKVVCKDLPRTGCGTDIHLGIQRGADVIDTVAVHRGSAIFEPVFRVAPAAGGATNFLGPFAKGTPHERYFYLSWLARRGDGELEMFRRAKVHLSHLPWAEVAQASEAGKPITVRLSLTDARGGPRCGSIRDGEAQWQL